VNGFARFGTTLKNPITNYETSSEVFKDEYEHSDIVLVKDDGSSEFDYRQVLDDEENEVLFMVANGES